MDTKISFTDFKEFIDTTTFEAENIILPPENGMLVKWADDNAQAWKMIQEMLENGELKYTPKNDKKRTTKKSHLLKIWRWRVSN